MNRHIDVDRLFEEWLADGPSQLSDRAIDSIVRNLDQTRQRKRFSLPGRDEMNRTFVALGGLAAAAVVIIVVGGIALGILGNRPGVGGEPASPSPTIPQVSPAAELSPTPLPAPTPDGNAVGEYTLHDGRHGGPPISVTLPASGWYGEPGGGILVKNYNPDAPDGAGLVGPFAGQVYVYGDPCQWRETIPDSPATTVDEVVDALTNQPSRDATEPVDIAVDGYAGKSVTIHVPDDARFADCDRGEFRTLVGDPVQDTARFHQDPGQIDEVWILDVGGELLVVFAAYYEGTPPEHVAEMRSILESMTFEELMTFPE